MTRVRVLVVDDQSPFRRAAASVVAAVASFELVGVVASAEECLKAVPELRPDLVLMDVNLPGMDGIDAARVLAGRPDPPVVVLLSTYPEDEYTERTAGVAGYLEKSRFGPERLAALWSALSGQVPTAIPDAPAGTDG
jgi:DNA-binding NarL/FixJ family response regulator